MVAVVSEAAMRHFLSRRLVQRTVVLGLLSLAGVGGCDTGGSRGGTLVISTAGDADVLFPPTIRQQQSVEVTDLLFERLANIGPDLNTLGDAGWQPRLARSWVWAADSMSVTFHLDARARWHDGRPVRASDVRFGYSVYVDSAVRSSDGRDIREVSDSLTVADSVTCTVWFRQRSPERFYRIAQNLRALPEHLLSGIARDSLATSGYARAPVGNGPFKFVRWDQRQRIEIAAFDDYHLGRPRLDRIIWTIVPENATAVQRVFAGEADFIQMLPPPQVADAWKHEDLRAVHLGSLGYSHMLFNQREGPSNRPHPLFSNRQLRRALTMATDRHAVMRNALDSLGYVPYGPFIREQWSADTTLQQLPLDRAGAERILDSLGWRKGANGIRQRAGKPLSFSLMVPASSASRVAAALVVQEQWRQLGVQFEIDRVDNATFLGRMNGRQFDAAMAGVAPQPSPSGIRQNWHTAALTMSNGLNSGSFSDPVIDAAIDSAVNATNVASARAHYRAAYQLLIDAAPAIWLLEPMRVGAVNRRVVLGPIPPHAWWSSLPTWNATGTAPGRADTAARSP
jgi:peptide/nickel transport system substrate-binding protein